MFMKRKGFSNVVVKVGARASALIALSLAIPMAVSLSSCDREEPNCPKKTVEEPKGIEVLIDYEDVATGETTRSLANGRSLGRLGEGFDVEAEGLKTYVPETKKGKYLDVKPELTFYAKENVVFQGWSWRYGTDKPGTQRDSKGNIINDYIATPALQPDAGQHKLDLSADKTSFTCKYDPNSDNKVYVKVKYSLSGFPVFSGKFIQLPGTATAWKQLQKGYQNKIIRHPLFGVGQPYYREAMDLINALTEAKQNEMKWLDAWYDVYNDPVMVEWDNAKKASYLENLYNEIVEAARNLASAAMKQCYITAPHVSYLNLGMLGVGINTGRSYPIFQLLDELGQYDKLLTGYDTTLLERSFTSLTDASYIKLLYDDKLKLELNLSINEKNQPIQVRRGKPLFFNDIRK